MPRELRLGVRDAEDHGGLDGGSVVRPLRRTEANVGQGVSVRWQIILPFAALVVLTSAVAAYVVTDLLQSSLETRFLGHLVESSRVAAESLVRRERAHLELTRSIAHTSGVASAIERDPAALERLVLPLATNAGIERVDVLDVAGAPVLRLQRRAGGDGYDTAADGTLDTAGLGRVLAGDSDERGDKFSDLAELGGETWIVTAAPIALDGTTRGVVLVATRLESALAAARTEALADLTVFGPDGDLLASTSAARREAASRVDAPETGAITELEVAARSYRELYADLHLRGEPVGYLSAALPSDFLAEAVSGAQWRMMLLLAVGLGATLLVGTTVARRLTGALTRLVATGRQVTAGNLGARARLTRHDEIGELGDTLDRMTQVLQRQHLGALAALVSAIDARDPYTRGHSLRVGHLAATLGMVMGLPPEQQHSLQVGGFLHDIGKIGVRDDVLLKPGRLEADERAAIEKHPTIGHEILAEVGLAPDVLAGVVFHHERLDGSGYPLGLVGEAIPITARVIMVADFYDALVTDRPYRAGLPPEDALTIMQDEVHRGKLDGDVMDALRRVKDGWEQLWRNDPRLTGFDLEVGALDPAMFTRAAA